MRRGELRQMVGNYVRHRLREECRVRGTAAKIERAIGFSSAHITNVQKEGRGVGEDFARAMASYWGVSYAQLEELAREWARQHPAAPAPLAPSLPPILRPLGELPGWPEAIEEARRRYRSIPDAIWDETAQAVLPSATEATIERVGRVAQILFDTSPGQPLHGTDKTAPYRKALEENPPTSSTTPRPGKGPPPRKKAGHS